MILPSTKLKLLFGLLLCLSALPAWPLASDREQPIHIESDQLEIDESKRQSLYQGHVEMRQGSLRIQADRIRFIFDADSNLQRLEIEGEPARLQQTDDQGRPLKGEARRIVYFNNEARLELIGNARLDNAGDLIESERIRFNLETSALEAGTADGGAGKEEAGRVRMVIQPRSAASPPASGPAESESRP